MVFPWFSHGFPVSWSVCYCFFGRRRSFAVHPSPCGGSRRGSRGSRGGRATKVATRLGPMAPGRWMVYFSGWWYLGVALWVRKAPFQMRLKNFAMKTTSEIVLVSNFYVSHFSRKITDKWSIFHCHVWLLEGILKNELLCLEELQFWTHSTGFDWWGASKNPMDTTPFPSFSHLGRIPIFTHTRIIRLLTILVPLYPIHSNHNPFRIGALESIDWFRGKITGKSHDLHGKIWLVSGEDFPMFLSSHWSRSVSATVDYVIDPPALSMDEMLWLTNTAHSNLLSESWWHRCRSRLGHLVKVCTKRWKTYRRMGKS